MDVAHVETTHILAYLNYLRTDYVPRRITGNNDKKLSPKTVYNLYISVASFFTWASREFQIDNPVKDVPHPRVPEDPPVEPFKKEEIEVTKLEERPLRWEKILFPFLTKSQTHSTQRECDRLLGGHCRAFRPCQFIYYIPKTSA